MLPVSEAGSISTGRPGQAEAMRKGYPMMRTSTLRVLAAAVLLGSLAAPAAASPLEDALDQAERLWNNDHQSAAVQELDQVVTRMESQRDFADPTQVTRAYWLQAQASFRYQRHCAVSYKAFTKLNALGFARYWPTRMKQHESLHGQLLECLPEQYRGDLAEEALAELSKADMRPAPASMAQEQGRAPSKKVISIQELLDKLFKPLLEASTGMLMMMGLLVSGGVLLFALGQSQNKLGPGIAEAKGLPREGSRPTAGPRRGLKRRNPWR